MVYGGPHSILTLSQGGIRCSSPVGSWAFASVASREAHPVRRPDALWSSKLGQDGRHGLFIRSQDD